MAKEFVRNIKETKLRGKNIEPLYTNEQNDLLSDKQHAYIRNNDYYFPLTQAILDIASSNGDGKNPVKPKLNIDGKENSVSLEWDTKSLGNNFVEQMPITITVDNEYNQIKIGIDHEGLYRFIKPYFTSTKDITVNFDDEQKTISYRLDDQAFFERLASHFKDGNGLDFVIDNEFKTVHYNLKDDKIKSIIFETVEAKDDDLAIEQQDGKLLIYLSEKNTKLLDNHSSDIKNLKSDVNINNEFINILSLSLEKETDKYNEKPVKKVTPETYIEGIDEDNLPLFYELNISNGRLVVGDEELNNSDIIPQYINQAIKAEKLLLIEYAEKTYVVNITNTEDVNQLTKEQINKHNKELLNLKVIEENDTYIAEFNEEDLETILTDLFTINSLEKI